MNHIGGDGFWLIREPSGRVRALMGAGRPGAKATPRFYRDARLRRDPDARAAGGAHRAGRGRRAGCWRARRRKRSGGKLPLDMLLAAAIGHARDGYVVTRSQARLTAGEAAGDGKARRLRRGVSARRQGAGRRRAAQADAHLPRRSSSSPMPGLTISIAAMSGARLPPISSASAAR